MMAMLPKGRLEAFADGVLAIVITILVLELEVPDATGAQDLLEALGEEWRTYLGYMISFVFVGGVWIAHSNATRLIARGDAMLFRLNLLVLFFVSLLPFITALMTTHLGHPAEDVAVAIYGLDLFVASLTLNVFIRYAATTPGIVADEVADQELEQILRERRGLLAAQGVAALIALVLPGVAVALYLVTAVAFIVTPLLLSRRRRGTTGGEAA